jgi:hypothetical protein
MVNTKTDIVIHELPHQFFKKIYCSMKLLLQYSLFSFCFLEKETCVGMAGKGQSQLLRQKMAEITCHSSVRKLVF